MPYYDSAWTSWTNTRTTAATTTAAVWSIWVDAGSVVDEFRARIEQTEEQQVEQRGFFAGFGRKRQEAEKVAEDLLLQCLTPEQRALYQRSKMFVVKGGKSGHDYEIDCSYASRNIKRSDGRRFCAHPPLDVPASDIFLAQKLAIECNEEHFLERANVS